MAVYTKIEDAALRAFLDDYAVAPLREARGIQAGVQNTNYLITTQDQKYILTLYEDTETGVDPKDLPFFLGLMQHLSAAGILCPTPVLRHDGALFGSLAGRPAALVSFLQGRSVSSPKPQHCRAVGAALAKLHLAGDDFAMHRPNTQASAQWPELFAQCAARAEEAAPELGKTIEQELARIIGQWPSDLPRGKIHADLFPDNVFFEDGGVSGLEVSGLIDFYFACEDAFAYDLAIMLNAWCFEPDINFNITKARALMAGYQSVRKLSKQEVNALPVLASGAAMRFLLTRLYDWLHQKPEALVTPKNPTDYLRRLRFHKNVTSPADYGLEIS
jgi:homoserine kinase type II